MKNEKLESFKINYKNKVSVMKMKNKILTLFRNNIPYIKELRILSGSVTASILMQQLDYWF